MVFPFSTPPEGAREPFIHSFTKDVSGGFAMGAIGGSLWHYAGGFRRPQTGRGRFSGGFQNMRMKAPATAGRFAAFMGIYSLVDSVAAHVRRKEDPYNRIIASTATGGLLACRKGLIAMACSSLGFGLFAIIAEGGTILFNRTEKKGVELPDSTPVMTPTLRETQRGRDGLGDKEDSSLFGGGARKQENTQESFGAYPPVQML